jgi:putative DNA-invertase from lambdoid prophage Rac
MQLRTMRAYAKQHGWTIGMEVRDIGSGANVRPEREAMLKAARRRELDVILVWRLDRWGRSLLDRSISSARCKNSINSAAASLSISEALDLTPASGRA